MDIGVDRADGRDWTTYHFVWQHKGVSVTLSCEELQELHANCVRAMAETGIAVPNTLLVPWPSKMLEAAKPDPIRECYEKWKDVQFFVIGAALDNRGMQAVDFISDAFRAMRQHCEGED